MMRMSRPYPKADTDRQAAYWFSELRRDDCPASTQKGFELWLTDSEENVEAYATVEAAWAGVEGLADDPDFMALRENAVRRHMNKNPHPPWAKTAAAGFVAIFGAVWAITLVSPTEPGAPATTGVEANLNDNIIATAVGERSTLTLEDGSVVDLNTDTAFRYALTDDEREIVLLRGQALFSVAHDPSRPFVVFAGNRRITALGTEFEVRFDRADVEVTLIDGQVEVAELAPLKAETARPQEPLRVVKLNPGQRVGAQIDTTETISEAVIGRALSWRHGRLEFEDESLSSVVYEINRYSKAKVRLVDDGLGDLRVSGSFLAGSVENFVSALTSIYPVTSERDADDPRVIHIVWENE